MRHGHSSNCINGRANGHRFTYIARIAEQLADNEERPVDGVIFVHAQAALRLFIHLVCVQTCRLPNANAMVYPANLRRSIYK